VAPSSSLEVRPPLQRFRMAASTFSPASWLEPRLCLPLRSVLAVSTTSTVCSAIHPRPGFPAQRSWGSVHPSGSSRLARAAPLPARPSPPELDGRLCLRSHFRFHLAIGPSGVCSSRRPSSLTSGFPRVRTRLPPGLLFVGPRSVRSSRFPKEARPATAARASSPAVRVITEVISRSRPSPC